MMGKEISIRIQTQYSNIPTFQSLASRMISLMYLFQPFTCHMGIDLCRRDVNMAEHQLHGAEIRSPFKKMAREGMAEEMGSDPFPDSSPPSVGLDALPEMLAAHRLSGSIDKEKRTLSLL